MKITSVRVKKVNVENEKFLGVASVVIDQVFIVRDIKIINGSKGIFIAMPSQKMPDGSYQDVAHPLNSDCRKLFQDAILKEYDNCE